MCLCWDCFAGVEVVVVEGVLADWGEVAEAAVDCLLGAIVAVVAGVEWAGVREERYAGMEVEIVWMCWGFRQIWWIR